MDKEKGENDGNTQPKRCDSILLAMCWQPRRQKKKALYLLPHGQATYRAYKLGLPGKVLPNCDTAMVQGTKIKYKYRIPQDVARVNCDNVYIKWNWENSMEIILITKDKCQENRPYILDKNHKLVYYT